MCQEEVVWDVPCTSSVVSTVTFCTSLSTPNPLGDPGSQDDSFSTDTAGELEVGRASAATSDCTASRFGGWMGLLVRAKWDWTDICGSAWAIVAGLARMSCGLMAACASCAVTGLAWMSCVTWPDGLACMSVASWLAGIVMMVIFSPAFVPAGSMVGSAWITSLGTVLAEVLATVTGTPVVVVRMGGEFNAIWPSELVMTTGIARMGLQG